MKKILVRILGYKKSQRYLIWRALMQAQKVFEKTHPNSHVDVEEITTVREMLPFTQVIAFPSLMIAEKLVCVGRFPAKEEILAWLETAAQKMELQDQIKI